MQGSRVILDQNGTETLNPPGQAIFTWGTHEETVMTPYLDDEERSQRLAYLMAGGHDLTEFEQQVLETAKRMQQNGQEPSVRGIRGILGCRQDKVTAALRTLRTLGLLEADMGHATSDSG